MPRLRRSRAVAAFTAWERDKPRYLAFDTETTGVAFHDTPFCVTLAWGKEAHYIELGPDDDVVRTILKRTPVLIAHNTKFDLQKCIQAGLIARADLTANRIEDTEALAHLLDEHQPKGLKALTRTHLGISTDEDEHLRSVRRKRKLRKDDGYHVLPRSAVLPYAIADAVYTLQLWQRFTPMVSRYPDLAGLYRREMELSLCLLDMESAGLGVDVEYAKAQLAEHDIAILRQQQRIQELVGREDFNPNSSAQILEAFLLLGVKLADTKAETLEKCNVELADAIVKLRKLNKIRSTYLHPLLMEQRRGILHPSFRQHGAKTGRMSSGANAG